MYTAGKYFQGCIIFLDGIWRFVDLLQQGSCLRPFEGFVITLAVHLKP